MTVNDVQKALLEDPQVPKEVRTNDGARYTVKSKQHWALSGTHILIVPDGPGNFCNISVRNIAAIGPVSRHKRRRA